MKKIFLLFCASAAVAVDAQPRVLTQATITTKTTIVAPEGDETQVQDMRTPDGGGEVRVMRFGGGDGETKTTTWLKNELVKTFSEGEMGRTTVIRDNNKKLTTTIMEIMGKKSGFYATDADQEQIRKRMDSMMQGRGQNMNMITGGSPATYSIIYLEESKKISGYDCKKALVIGTRTNGRADTTIVWYTPEFKFQNLASTGGALAGLGGFNVTSSTGFEALNGFPMQYERTMGRGRKMTVQVTKLIIDKDVADKEFDIAKDIEIKAMKDIQGGGPGMQMRVVTAH